MQVTLRVLPVGEGALVELVIVLIADLVFVFLPERNHGVEGFLFHGVDGLSFFGRIGNGLLHIHFDRITDVITVLLDEVADRPLFQEFTELLIFRIILEFQGDGGADSILFNFRNGIAVFTGRNPAVCLVSAGRAGINGDFFGDHEGAVETDTELTDDIDLGCVLFQSLAEFRRTGTGNRSEIGFQFLLIHTDTGIFNDQCPGFLIRGDLDPEIFLRSVL